MKLLLLVLLPALSFAGPTVELSSSNVRDPHQLVYGVLPATAAAQPLQSFPERLTLRMTWGIFEVGTATLEVESVVDFNGRPAYHIVSRAQSNEWCDSFYKVRDINESWVDGKTLNSLGYLKKLREGKYFRDEWVLYDYKNKRQLWRTEGKDGNFEYGGGDIPGPLQDVLSSIFYVRSKPLEPGTSVELDVNTKKTWPLVVKVVKREKIKVPAGKFDTILVEPELRDQGLFIQKGKKLQVWLTDDARRMPVQMKVEVFFGHVAAKLTKAQ